MSEFDQQAKLVTSYAFSPIFLAAIRLLIALFTLVVLVYQVIWETVETKEIESYFSYFTNLTFVGICAYFFASGVQTLFYARNIKRGRNEYPLQRWPKFLRYLHVLLLSTIITFPILVTIVYWVLLASPSSFETPYASLSNIAKHALNSAFAVFEIALTNVGPMPWIDLPVTVVLLGGYLGVAYITHATQGIYTYSFLDPKKQGAMLAAYIVGIAVGQCVIFLIVLGFIHLREKLTRGRREKDAARLQYEKTTNPV